MQVQGEGFSVEMFAGFAFQAFGDIAGRQFFFHACRYDWEFEVANDSGKMPSDGGLLPGEASGTEYQSRWFRVGTLNKWSEEITEDDALAIIHECVRDYKKSYAV